MSRGGLSPRNFYGGSSSGPGLVSGVAPASVSPNAGGCLAARCGPCPCTAALLPQRAAPRPRELPVRRVSGPARVPLTPHTAPLCSPAVAHHRSPLVAGPLRTPPLQCVEPRPAHCVPAVAPRRAALAAPSPAFDPASRRIVRIDDVTTVAIPVQRIVEKIVYVPVPKILEIPTERIIERRVEVLVPKDVERLIEVPVDKVVYVPVEHLVEDLVEVEVLVEKFVERRVEVPADRTIERVIEVPVERVVERVITVEVPVERVVEVERVVHVPVPRIVEKIVEVPYSEELFAGLGSRVAAAVEPEPSQSPCSGQAGHLLRRRASTESDEPVVRRLDPVDFRSDGDGSPARASSEGSRISGGPSPRLVPPLTLP